MASAFFENFDCDCYPCHDLAEINCLFCFCPLYLLPDCPGNPIFAGQEKDCSACTYPHKRDSRDKLLWYLKNHMPKIAEDAE